MQAKHVDMQGQNRNYRQRLYSVLGYLLHTSQHMYSTNYDARSRKLDIDQPGKA